MTSRHLMLGFPLKSSRHPAGALPVFERVPGDDPPSAEADGRNDALFQHRVDGDPPDGEPASDFGNRHSAAHIVRPSPLFRLGTTEAPWETRSEVHSKGWRRFPGFPFLRSGKPGN